MAVPQHVLGNLRWIIVGVCAVSGGIAFCLRWPIPGDLDLISKIIRYGFHFGGALLIGYILTAELLIRLYLSILIAVVSTATMMFITHLLLKAFQLSEESSFFITIVVGALTALVTLIGGYQLTKDSSWIGVACPNCSTRGKLQTTEGSKYFIGSELKEVIGTVKSFNNYEVEVTETCNNCGASRSWTKQESQEA